jgi:serine/threonine protein kinase
MDQTSDSNNRSIFMIDDKIGSGSFGDVYKGVHEGTKEPIAIKKFKVFKNDYGISPEILREIIILRNLDHENIIRY